MKANVDDLLLTSSELGRKEEVLHHGIFTRNLAKKRILIKGIIPLIRPVDVAINIIESQFSLTDLDNWFIDSTFVTPSVDRSGESGYIIPSDESLLLEEKNGRYEPKFTNQFTLKGDLGNVDGKLILICPDLDCPSLNSDAVYDGDVDQVIRLNGPLKQVKAVKNELKEIVVPSHREPKLFKVFLKPGSFDIVKLIVDKTIVTKEAKRLVANSYAPVFTSTTNLPAVDGLSISQFNSLRIDLLSNDVSVKNSISEFSPTISHVCFTSELSSLEFFNGLTLQTLEKQQTLLKRYVQYQIRFGCVLHESFKYVVETFDKNSLSMTANSYKVIESIDHQFDMLDSNGNDFSPSLNETSTSIEDAITVDLDVLCLATNNRFKLLGYSLETHFSNLSTSLDTLEALNIDSRIAFLKQLNSIMTGLDSSKRKINPIPFKMDDFREWVYLMALLLMLKNNLPLSDICNLLGCSNQCPSDDKDYFGICIEDQDSATKHFFYFNRANGNTNIFDALRVFLHFAPLSFVGVVGLNSNKKDVKNLLNNCITILSNNQDKKVYSSRKTSKKQSIFNVELTKTDDSDSCKAQMIEFLSGYTEPELPSKYVLN